MAQLEKQVLPLQLHPMDGNREQRATQRAFSYWNRLRGEQRMPLFCDFRYIEEPPCHDAQFLLKQDSLVANSVFILCGDQAAAAFGGRPIRKTLIESAPEALREQMTADCENAIAASAPAGSEGWYHGKGGTRVHYRYIFLPLEASFSRFGYIFGAYSSKEQERATRPVKRRSTERGTRTPELRSVV